MRFVATVGLFVVVTGAVTADQARAQRRAGLYVSQELGAHFAPGLTLDGDSNGRASICDDFINPFADLMPASCGDLEAGTSWTSRFDRARGLLAGSALGYRLEDGGRIRLELEYFFRESAYNQTSPIEARGGVAVAKLDGEVVAADDRVGSVTSHNLFANVYVDLANASRVTPYVGFGAGYGFTRMDYGLLWIRNDDPDLITSIAPHFPADRLDDLRTVQRNLASTASSLQTELADRVLGYQAVFGVDYALSGAVSIGLKGRRTVFRGFSTETGLDRLRSHAPTNRRDGSDPLTTTLAAGETVLTGVALNLKVGF